jgi:hypothetical protein
VSRGETSPPSRRYPDKRPDPIAVFWDIRNVYPLVAAGLGLLSAIWAGNHHKVIEEETTILIAMAGASVAVLAVILTATALMAGLLQGFFGLVVDTAEGLRNFYRPIIIVAFISAAASLASFGGAIHAFWGSEHARAVLFGVAAGLTTWSILGTVWVVLIFARYAVRQRAALTREELEEAELQTLREQEEREELRALRELLVRTAKEPTLTKLLRDVLGRRSP